MKKDLTTLEQRLALLVEMPTVSHDTEACRKAIESLAEELSALGMYVKRELDTHPTLVATTRPTLSPRLMLVAHLDVVPPTNGAECHLTIKDSRLRGRGVFDMKFAAACYLQLVHELAERNELEAYDFGIMLTTDEELGGTEGVGRLLKDGWSTELALIPDGGENWAVEAKAKGIASLRLTANGRSAHGSRPWEGDNAVSRLLAALYEAEHEYPYKDKEALTLSINLVSGGTAMNQIPDSAEATIDMRAFNIHELTQAEHSIRAIADTHDVKVETLILGNPVTLSSSSRSVKTALTTLEEFLGRPVEFSTSYGTTDGRWFSFYDIPTFIVRPQGGDIHGPSEWMLRKDLSRFYTFVKHLAEDLTPQPLDETVKKAQTV